MSLVPRMAFAHMGIFVSNLALMVDFYASVLGFCVTDRANIQDTGVAFLSRNPAEHHQIALVSGRNPEPASTINQISFRVISLPELRRVYERLVDEEVSPINAINHGGS